MSKKLYVGNLHFSTTAETLRHVFGSFGTVLSATIITDPATGQSKGFGFVELAEDRAAAKAIAAKGGTELDGRRIRVSLAEERRPRPSGSVAAPRRNRRPASGAARPARDDSSFY